MAEFERLTNTYGEIERCANCHEERDCEARYCVHYNDAIERLTAYEDSGLSPDRIAAYKKALEVFWEANPKRSVYYISDGKVYVMGGDTVLLLLQRKIVDYYDTIEDANAAAEATKEGGKNV